MRALLCFLCIVTHVWTVNANVEKTIFLGPRPVTFSNDRPSLEELRLATLSPTQKPFLGTKLAVQFPTTETPRGLESWYILQNLHDGRRYEARICWPATVCVELPLMSMCHCASQYSPWLALCLRGLPNANSCLSNPPIFGLTRFP